MDRVVKGLDLKRDNGMRLYKIRMVYTLNMLGRGRCLDMVVRSFYLKEDSDMRLFNHEDSVKS